MRPDSYVFTLRLLILRFRSTPIYILFLRNADYHCLLTLITSRSLVMSLFLRKKLATLVIPLLVNTHFHILSNFSFLCNSGFPVIFSASEDLPDSLSVIPVRLSKYVVLDDFNIGTIARSCKFILWFLLTCY